MTWPGYFIGVLSVVQDRRVVERHSLSYECRQNMLMNNAPPGKVKGKRATDGNNSPEVLEWEDKWGLSRAQTLGVVPRECELEPDGSGADDPVALRVLMEHVRRERVTNLHRRDVRDFILASVLVELRHTDPALAIGDVMWKLRHTLALLKSSSRESASSRSARVRCRYGSNER